MTPMRAVDEEALQEQPCQRGQRELRVGLECPWSANERQALYERDGKQ